MYGPFEWQNTDRKSKPSCLSISVINFLLFTGNYKQSAKSIYRPKSNDCSVTSDVTLLLGLEVIVILILTLNESPPFSQPLFKGWKEHH